MSHQKLRPRIVIIGGGFGGIKAAKLLGNKAVDVTLIDRKNHHTFQPLLYQVATAVLSPSEIALSIRRILHPYDNINVVLGEVVGFNHEKQAVSLQDGSQVHYDYLIVAAGARHSYFGRDEWEKEAPGLKTIEDAVEIRRRVLMAFEVVHVALLIDPRHRVSVLREWLWAYVSHGRSSLLITGDAERAR